LSTRVVLADDQTVVRAGFKALLDLTDDIVVVGEAANGREALTVTRRSRPDLVLMDIRMPIMDGLEATRLIVGDRHLEEVRVLILTTFETDEYVYEALRVGASGFLLKDVEPDDLRSAIRLVAGGHSLLAPSITRRVIEDFVRSTTATERLNVLTDREREVLRSVATGLSNAEVGERLHMSPLTAKTHVSRIMTKVGARDRVQLVVLAYETGLVRAGD
jgi:DNA-binding NarL/FixJ family response regulator